MPSHKNDNSTPYDSGSNYTEDGLTFAQMFEQSLQQNTVNEGQVVTGKVVSIGAETVLIDVGYKCEGEVPIGEFKDHQGNVTAQVGDELPVLIESFESEKGTLRLSKLKAEMSLAWEEIAQACERGDVLEGTVVEVVRGGLTVDIGVRAFLPVKFNKKRGNIVLSRKSVMEEEREQLKSSTLKQIKVGAIVRGLVKNITDYGAFVDLGGIDGLLHITDASWGRVKNLADLLKIGQEINVRVLKYDQEKERVSLGLKQTQPDPWQDMETRYRMEQRSPIATPLLVKELKAA